MGFGFGGCWYTGARISSLVEARIFAHK